MALELLAHPFSAYCQKVLIALYENDIPFTWRVLHFDDAEIQAEFASLWPLQRMPVLVDDGRVVVESSIIIEHLDLTHPGTVRLIPKDPEAALPVRSMDRVFDNYVMTPMQRIVFDALRPTERRDDIAVSEAKALLDRVYGWLDGALAAQPWAAGAEFSLADCAAAPALFYADWVHPIDRSLAYLRDYRQRLLARPSMARVVEEARPYRRLFPPGAPDRD